MRPFTCLVLAGATLAATGADCIPIDPSTGKPRVAALRGFSSAEDLRGYLADQALSERNPFRSGIPLFGLPVFNSLPPAAPGAAEDATSGDGGGYSTTNIQEAGVDESDIVKNDGDTIYVLEGDTIHIVDATPASGVAEVATVTLDEPGDSLYLRGNQLIAISQRYTYYYFDGPVPFDGIAASSGGAADLIGGPWNDGSQVTVTLIDVTDPAAPAVQATLQLEGGLASSRLIDNKLHLVLSSVPRLATANTNLAIRAMTLDDWLPDYRIMDGSGAEVASGDIASWDGFFRPEDPDGYGITTVATIDLDDPEAPPTSTAVSANAGVIYASTEALYVTDPDYSSLGFVSREDTIVHKLSFTDNGTTYAGSGLVPGRPLNQYSLGEHDGDLRIATTLDTFGGDGFSTGNGVYVLREANNASLDVIGKIENIAPGEQIYAARFIGERGFLVTFRRVDPLFTLDLSDPENPQIVGELKVPGFSDHIQLLDENHLLTIGKDTVDAGTFAWIQGVQLSIFDVTDPTNPTLLHKEVIGGRGSNSEANYNPKAFNFYAPLGVLAFPMEVYSEGTTGAAYGGYEFTGLYVYDVSVENGFEIKGRIAASDPSATVGCFYYGYGGFSRGVFIGDHVYAVTATGVKAADLADVETIVGEAEFAGEDVPDNCYFAEADVILPIGVGVR